MTTELNGYHQLLDYILQNIFFCVQQKKETLFVWNNLRVSK